MENENKAIEGMEMESNGAVDVETGGHSTLPAIGIGIALGAAAVFGITKGAKKVKAVAGDMKEKHQAKVEEKKAKKAAKKEAKEKSEEKAE